LKGIGVVGTGDFTHPEYFRELTEKLEPAGGGLFSLKEAYQREEVPPRAAGR
jgi:PHP family Zn ribbon phosphoesterase